MKPIEKHIKIKTEQGVKQDVKIVNRQADSKCLPQRTQVDPNAWQQQKEILVQQIISLKSENQNLTLELKNNQSENTSLLSKQHELNVKINTLTNELNALNKAHLDYVAKHLENEKKISGLTHENQSLLARIKQLETGIQQKYEQLMTKKIPASRKNYSQEEEVKLRK